MRRLVLSLKYYHTFTHMPKGQGWTHHTNVWQIANLKKFIIYDNLHKLGGNIQNHCLDGCYKNQVAMGKYIYKYVHETIRITRLPH